METPESITMNLPSPTPSPTPSSNSNMTGTPGPSGSASRRPPRKSTLTQQQKNQKRQRATQDQLGLLEIEFDKNATPTAAVRERIAQEINMTERSVQIWFQNRWVNITARLARNQELTRDMMLTTAPTGAPRSSFWPRRASRLARTATPSLTR